MNSPAVQHPPAAHVSEAGFSLIELLVSVVILTVVSATALTGVLSLSKSSSTVSNRTEMHAAVRNATELLQQEVGQAGRITLPDGIAVAVAVNPAETTFKLNTTNGIFVGEYLTVDTGGDVNCTVGCEETVRVSAIDTATNTVAVETDAAVSHGHREFWYAHTVGAPVRIAGGFASGVVPQSPAFPNGSTGDRLKIFGDINGDGNMVYIEYSCDLATGNLYRRSVVYTSANLPAATASESLLNNIVANPDGSACFTYQEQSVGPLTFVVDVAITLTIQTAAVDPVTGLFQRETKALLNVSPRNVFNVWQLAGLGLGYRVQPMPPTVANLITLP